MNRGERDDSQPAPTITSKADRIKKIESEWGGGLGFQRQPWRGINDYRSVDTGKELSDKWMGH